MAFNQQYNTDNVLLRSVIVGLLDLLNTRLQINQVVDNVTTVIPVPFFYQKYGSERFLQDFFINFMKHPEESCNGPQIIEGGIEPVPRGILSLSGISVNSASLTSKFVRGTYNKEIDGEVKAFSSMLNIIPLALTFDVQIISNTLIESMKITQEAIGAFYKAAKFNVDYNGFMVPCQAGFSEDYQTEKQLQFTYGDGEDKIIVRFTIEIETYLPVPDSTTERWRGNVMDNGIGNNITVYSNGIVSADFNIETKGANLDDIISNDTNGNPL